VKVTCAFLGGFCAAMHLRPIFLSSQRNAWMSKGFFEFLGGDIVMVKTESLCLALCVRSSFCGACV